MKKVYPSYMEIKQKWVKQIPSHWEMKRLKSIFAMRKERNDPVITTNILSLTAKQGVVPYAEKEGTGGNKPKEDLTKYNIAHENDLLVNCMNVVSGAAGVSKYYGAISPVYYALYPRNDENVWYYHHIFRLLTFQRSLIGLGKGILMHESENGTLTSVRMRISMDYLGNVLLPIPSCEEQDQIVRFLDWKVSEINKLISLKQKQIGCFNSKLLTVTNALATHGIKRNVSYIKTNMDWAPDIPCHWSVSRIRNHFKILKRIAGKEGFDVFSVTQQGLKVRDVALYEGQLAANYSGYQFVHPGEFAMNHMDLLTGGVGIADHLGVTSPDYRVFRLFDDEHCYAPYYLTIFQICYRRHAFYRFGRGAANVGRWRLPATAFKNFEIPLPPYDEQVLIVQAIEQEAHNNKVAIECLQKQIEVLKEFRTRLISDVVTGKIDVRGIEIPEYKYTAKEANTDPEAEDNEMEEGDDEV